MTNDDKLFARLQGWAEAGGLWRPDRFAPARWKGELFCGVNYRMSELEGTVELVQFRKMEAQLNRWRKNKKLIMSNLPAYKELRPRVVNDIDGEMGHSIGFFPGTAKESEQLSPALYAEGLGAGTRGTSTHPNWHYYQYMEMIMNKVPATSDGCPWECPNAGEAAKVNYSFDMCPNTIDLTSRYVSVGINQWWNENDCMKVAQAMTKVFDAFYTRDEKYDSWLSAVTDKS
jgi:dTDP-4-amino-4,6-dideoxygalactose transaminase